LFQVPVRLAGVSGAQIPDLRSPPLRISARSAGRRKDFVFPAWILFHRQSLESSPLSYSPAVAKRCGTRPIDIRGASLDEVRLLMGISYPDELPETRWLLQKKCEQVATLKRDW
jgi:hypothetical protein